MKFLSFVKQLKFPIYYDQLKFPITILFSTKKKCSLNYQLPYKVGTATKTSGESCYIFWFTLPLLITN